MARGVAQRRVVQREQPVVAGLERLERDPHQHRVALRVGHVALRDAVAARIGRVDLLIDQRPLVDQPDGVRRVLALAVHERTAVGDGELQRANIRGVAAGVVHLAHRAVRQRVPDLRVAANRSAQALLVAGRPVRRRAGRPWRHPSGSGSRRQRAPDHHGDDNDDDPVSERRTNGHCSTPISRGGVVG